MKMLRKNGTWVIIFIILLVISLAYFFRDKTVFEVVTNLTDNQNMEGEGGLEDDLHPLSIESLRKGEYPGSDIVIEQTLESGTNYKRYIAAYKSEGLKIYALLTVPDGNPPGGLASSGSDKGGWPVIIFNHGYISPGVYRTTERYVAYQDAFARAGYVTFKSDYRGHGNSEGQASGGYGSNAYTIDILNALSSIKKYPGVDEERIGMWGHSMGGSITLKTMVVTKDIKAGVIWAGVVGSYPDLVERWRRRQTTTPQSSPAISGRGRWRQELIAKYGEPSENPDFWKSISANSYLADISGPFELHHGTSDTSVPIEFSQKLATQMKDVGKEVELFEYAGDNHNLSNNFTLAINRSVDFFDKHLK